MLHGRSNSLSTFGFISLERILVLALSQDHRVILTTPTRCYFSRASSLLVLIAMLQHWMPENCVGVLPYVRVGLLLANHQHLTLEDNLEDTLFSIVEYQELQLLVRSPGLAHDTCRLTIHGFRIGLLLPMIPWIVAGVVFFMVGATAAAVFEGAHETERYREAD